MNNLLTGLTLINRSLEPLKTFGLASKKSSFIMLITTATCKTKFTELSGNENYLQRHFLMSKINLKLA